MSTVSIRSMIDGFSQSKGRESTGNAAQVHLLAHVDQGVPQFDQFNPASDKRTFAPGEMTKTVE